MANQTDGSAASEPWSGLGDPGPAATLTAAIPHELAGAITAGRAVELV